MYNLVHFLSHLHRSQTGLVLDVGANTGQFALELFKVGYMGQVISFEPLTAAHAALKKAAQNNRKWKVTPCCAIGASVGRAIINIAGNSSSSSLRPMLERCLAAAPESAYVGTETVHVETLARFIAGSFPGVVPRFALKIDTQGFEDQVLDGLGAYIEHCTAILLEMPLRALYGGAADLPTLFARLVKCDLHCVGLSPGHKDPRTGDAIEVDGLFVRDISAEQLASALLTSLPTYCSDEAEVSAAKSELAAIKASTSWRITAPLRYLVDIFR